MVKKLVALISVLAMCISMVACGGEQTDDSSSAKDNSEVVGKTDDSSASDGAYEPTYGEVEIEMWYSIGGEGDAVRQLADQYEAEHPNVKINTTQYNMFDVQTKLVPALAGGTAPDIFEYGMGSANVLGSAGYAVNLTEYLEARGFDESNYISEAIKVSKYEGDLYALPSVTDVRIVYYNKDLFEAAGLDPEITPATWEEMVDYAGKLTKFDDAGNITQIGFTPSLGNCYVAPMIWTHGAEMMDEEGNLTFCTDEMIAAYQTIIDCMNACGGADAISAYAEASGTSTIDAFCMGEVAMIIQTDDYVRNILKYAPDMNWGAFEIPVVDEETEKATWSCGFTLAVSDHGEDRVNASIDFMLWLLDKEQMRYIADETGNLVAYREAYVESVEARDDLLQEYIDAVMSAYEHARYYDVCLEYPSYTETLLSAYWKIGSGDYTAEEALTWAQEVADQEVANYHFLYD